MCIYVAINIYLYECVYVEIGIIVLNVYLIVVSNTPVFVEKMQAF